jgi:integrase
MRLAAYLCTSRHGIFYFRFPLPIDCHPAQQRQHLKVSLKTREPRVASLLSRLLTVSGQSLLGDPMVRAMRYDEMRQHVRDHFAKMLQQFREKCSESGPAGDFARDTLRTSLGLAKEPLGDWLGLTHYEDTGGLVRAFCEVRNIADIPEGREAELLAAELQKGYREYVARALEHTEEFDTISLTAEMTPQPVAPNSSSGVIAAFPANTMALADVLERYFAELDRTKVLAAKTESEKRDALALMAELTGGKPPATMTKVDAQEVKAALFKLPKNRSKNPKTRALTLTKQLELTGVERIAARTMNVYLGHMQHFMGWAVDNGYAADNPFQGLRLKRTARGEEDGRKPFSASQLQTMFGHLTDAHSSLVKKEAHKWPALIGMFTGMRLNEIAQLEVQDIEVRDGVWCINVTPDGDDNKRLKNASSKRRVPVHSRLVSCGFLDFLEARKMSGNARLFPSLTYSAQNGYGRNAGRWFNDRFLPELGLGSQGLSFHCLRHTMITRLAQSGVEEPLVKALVGHSQTGVTYSTYFKEGFLPGQLEAAINRFNFYVANL